MIFILASLLFLTLAGAFSSHRGERIERRDAAGRVANSALVILSSVATVAGFAAWLAVVSAAANAPAALRSAAWMRSLPLAVLDDRAPLYGHAPFGDLAALAYAVQSVGLYALFLSLRGRRTGRTNRRIIAAAFAIMAVLAIGSRYLTSFDLYAYAGAVHRGLGSAYHPGATPFSGSWAVLNAIYGNPIVPSPYGPIWLIVSYAATGWTASLAAALIALRLVDLAAFAACIFALRALHVSPASIAVFAVNPALFSNFVVDGHNDLVAVSLVLVAASLRKRWPVGAIILAGAAGAIKLPFLVIAPLAFVFSDTPKRRLYPAAAIFVLGLALSLAVDGTGYVASIRQTALLYHATFADPIANSARLAIATSVALLVAVAIVRRRFVPTASWAFSVLAASLFSWYLAWGLPYAIAERRWLPAFLISLPWLTYVMSTTFAKTTLSVDSFYLTLVLGPVVAALALRHERTAGLRSSG